MGFRELITKVQIKSGLSDQESQEALELMVESLAERLENEERNDFASQLPSELQEIALAVMPSPTESDRDILQEFMEKENIAESRAKTQILAAWEALQEAVSEGELRHIKAQLPYSVMRLLT